jgi:hypothetical protein
MHAQWTLKGPAWIHLFGSCNEDQPRRARHVQTGQANRQRDRESIEKDETINTSILHYRGIFPCARPLVSAFACVRRGTKRTQRHERWSFGIGNEEGTGGGGTKRTYCTSTFCHDVFFIFFCHRLVRTKTGLSTCMQYIFVIIGLPACLPACQELLSSRSTYQSFVAHQEG